MKLLFGAILAGGLAAAASAPAAPARPHNVLIFVADGLRYVGVTAKSAPALWRIKTQGVGFEDDPTLGAMNDHFGGNYLNETSLIAAAREAGFSTAVMGKVGPTAIQDVTQRD